MSNFVWCHGPSCHKSHTQDRIRGVKGSKVLRTKKVQQHNTSSWYSANNFYNYFCSQGCYNDFANTHIQQIVAIAPRTEALETPVSIERVESTTFGGHKYMETRILTVDNNGG
jgi:YHS domain-containing protein